MLRSNVSCQGLTKNPKTWLSLTWEIKLNMATIRTIKGDKLTILMPSLLPYYWHSFLWPSFNWQIILIFLLLPLLANYSFVSATLEMQWYKCQLMIQNGRSLFRANFSFCNPFSLQPWTFFIWVKLTGTKLEIQKMLTASDNAIFNSFEKNDRFHISRTPSAKYIFLFFVVLHRKADVPLLLMIHFFDLSTPD